MRTKRVSIWISIALILVAGLFIPEASDPVGSVLADTSLVNLQLGQNPDYSRVGRLSPGTDPKRKDYVFLGVDPTDTNPEVENRRTWLEARTPTGAQIFRVDTTQGGRKPMQAIVDVVDLNGDGVDEIVGMFGAEISRGETPLIFVYNHDGSLQWCTDQFEGVVNGEFKANMQLKPQRVKIFKLKSSNQRNIVAVPNTDGNEPTNLGQGACSGSYANVRLTGCTSGAYTNASTFVYFYNYAGALPDVPNGNPVPVSIPAVNDSLTIYPNREMVTRPGIVVGDIDAAGNDNEVVVISKQRIMVFDENGRKVYFKQFADSAVNAFVGYNPEADDPDGSASTWNAWGGRRYGVYKLTDIDVPKNGTLELVMAGDQNAIVDCTSPGAIYEAYRLTGTSGDGYLPRVWRWWLRNTSAELTPKNSSRWPELYRLGCPFFGIQDVNGDGYDDVVLGRVATSQVPCVEAGETDSTKITIVETRADLTPTARLHETSYAGIPLDLVKWNEGSPRDIVAYNNVTQEHYVYRVSSSFVFTTVATFATGSKLLHRSHSESADFPPEVGSNSPMHAWLHTPATLTDNGITTQIVEQSPRTCDGGTQTLRAWTANGTSLVQTMLVSNSPGRVVNILCASDRSSPVWLFEDGTSCTANTNRVSTYTQTGSALNLFAGGGTGVDTIGVYIASSGAFFLRNANSPGIADLVFNYGPTNASQSAIMGDWDGDGDDTAGVYVPASGTFFLRNANSAGAADLAFSFGPAAAGYVPLAGDWNGDGIDTIGLYQPSTGFFFLRNSNAPGPADLTFGYGAANANLVPLTGDWDGDGDDTAGLYQPSSGFFFLRNSNTAGSADLVFGYGPVGAGITPIVGDWDGDGDDTAGVYVASGGSYFLRNANSAGPADLVFNYGPGGARPLVGNWDGDCDCP